MNNEQHTEPLPCPRCGEQPGTYRVEDEERDGKGNRIGGGVRYHTECLQCDSDTPPLLRGEGATVEESVQDWNDKVRRVIKES